MSWLAILLAAVLAGAASAPRRPHHVAPHQRLAAHAPRHRPSAIKRPQVSPRPSVPPVPVGVAPPGPAPTPTPAPTATATPDYPTRTGILIDDDPDYTMHSSDPTLKAGVVTFSAANYGLDDHNLTIAGVAGASVDVPAGGDPYTLEVTLAPGTYRLFCSLTGHDAAGMHTTIAVR